MSETKTKPAAPAAPAPKKEVYYSVGTNFVVQMTRPRRMVVDGEFITDHGRAIVFNPLDGPGSSYGSRYETDDPEEIAFLDKQCEIDRLHVSKKYRMPVTAKNSFNEDVSVIVAEETENGKLAFIRKQANEVAKASRY